MRTFEVGLSAFCVMILSQSYGGQGVECGSLNVTGPLKIIGSGTISRCCLVGGSVSLWRWVLRSPIFKLCPGLQLSAPSLAPCLPAPAMSDHDNNVAMVRVSLHSNRNPN